MKLKSRGLGRKELVMDFREYEIARDGDDVVVSGTIREPVNWDFTIRINGDDIPGMLRLGLHRHTLAMAVRWVFRRSAKTAPAPEAPPVAARPRAATELPRATAADAPVPTQPVAPSAKPVVASSAPAPRSTSSVAKTPDFGVPRRRGNANGSNGAHAPSTDVIAEGEPR